MVCSLTEVSTKPFPTGLPPALASQSSYCLFCDLPSAGHVAWWWSCLSTACPKTPSTPSVMKIDFSKKTDHVFAICIKREGSICHVFYRGMLVFVWVISTAKLCATDEYLCLVHFVPPEHSFSGLTVTPSSTVCEKKSLSPALLLQWRSRCREIKHNCIIWWAGFDLSLKA